MSDEMKKTPLRIHTFAGDLNFERNKRGLTSKPQPAVAHKESLAKSPKKETPPKPTPKVHTMPKIVVPAKKKEASTNHKLPKKVPHTITRIPAFHEIKKHTKTNDNDEPSTKKNKG